MNTITRTSKKPWHSVLFTLSALVLVACGDSPPATPEKGHEIKASGYVDLVPPSNYSPERGVVCYSGSIDVAGELTGACFNTSGSSPFLTQQHISLSAARAVNQNIETDTDASRYQTIFEVSLGFSCNSAEQTCYYTGGDEADAIVAARHTKALYGFPRLPRVRTGEWPDIPPLSMQDYRWLDAKQLSLPTAASPEQIAEALKTAFAAKEPAEGSYTEVMAQYADPADNSGMIVFTLSNVPDDSVRSIQYVVETGQSDVSTKITGFGQRFQCWRGANAERWTKELCL